MENNNGAPRYEVREPRLTLSTEPPPPPPPEAPTVITVSEPVNVIISTSSINLDINIHRDYVTIYPYPFNRDH
ncbi:hypothetical protein Lal_00003674 [Lupinus albus]|nr:hypothetical protein Lal_00003674 [Lupinus albus]